MSVVPAASKANPVDAARPAGSGFDADAALACHQAMVAARRVDEWEAKYVTNGEAFFHVAGAGHEASAALNAFLKPCDWLHLHYRDKALMLARGLTPEDFFHSVFCSAESHSYGRQMSAHMSDPSLHVLSLVGPVGNNALQAVGVAAETKDRDGQPITVCAVGDGTSQQGEFLEAMAEAVRDTLPVLFLIHDNALAISTHTRGKTWYDTPQGPADQFYGVKIHRIDGRKPQEAAQVFGQVVAGMRDSRQPAIVVMATERLSNHTNADDESIYRPVDERQQAKATGDPITLHRQFLLAQGVKAEAIDQLETDTRAAVDADAAKAEARSTIPETAKPIVSDTLDRDENRGQGEPSLTMIAALKAVFDQRLKQDERVSLHGQDIEDPKGDVFGLTRGLSTAYPGRVANAPLTESTIVGKAIGRALAGGRPVGMIQFADFLPLAFNQILSEMGSMAWRTNDQWGCPAIITAPCGGYRPGLGPFHAQSLESVMAHVPGIQVVMPSTATDAVGLMQAAFESKHPTVYLYPKVCLNDRDRKTPQDTDQQFVPIGKARHWTTGDDVTIVTYGGTTYQCELAANALIAHGVGVDLIDLRTIQPWDKDAVIASAKRTGRLIVVHEDNLSCSVASEIVATVSEALPGQVEARRMTRPDVFVPCNFDNQLQTLPSYQAVLETACDMLGIGIKWQADAIAAEGELIVEAQGSSPADQAVTVAEWRVAVGDTVAAGDPIADLEADKAVFELTSQHAGTVRRLLAEPGVEVRVGSPLMVLAGEGSVRPKPATRENPGTPILTGSPRNRNTALAGGQSDSARKAVTIGMPTIVHGGRVVTNEELTARQPDRVAADIEPLTGIRSRHWVAEGQNALTLATEAAQAALKQHGLQATDLDAIVVSTTTPLKASPSMACMLLGELAGSTHTIPAHDVSAACSGYLYALTAGFDHVANHPGSRVLVVTTEVLSPVMDPNDFDTAILFGDAATATILGDTAESAHCMGLLERPVLSAKSDQKDALYVGFGEAGGVFMDGKVIFGQAVRAMKAALETVCDQGDVALEDLKALVPHQANRRILSAVADRLPNGQQILVDTIAETGNTSSSSIPLALNTLGPLKGLTGLCAFGGGFTYGAALIRPRPRK